MKRFSNQSSGYSLVELLVVIAVLGILTVVAVLAIQGTVYQSQLDRRVTSDLQGISNALEQYRKDNGEYPLPAMAGSHNMLCFNADATYAHDCDSAAFKQAQIDNGLLAKNYLPEVPTDPRTRGRYVYGITYDRQYYQVAGVLGSGTPEARLIGNVGKGFYLPSIIRSYNSAEFVVNRGAILPYDPTNQFAATARNVVGNVQVTVPDGAAPNLAEGDQIVEGATLKADPGAQADIYFPDGSVTHLDGAELTLLQMDLVENDEKNIATKILLRLDAGEIWNKVVRLASKSEFQVESTGAVAGVRGTEFGMKNESNITTYYVWSGEVGVETNVAPEAVKGVVINDMASENLNGVITGTPDVPAISTLTGGTLTPVTTIDSGVLDYMKGKAQTSLNESLVPYINGFTAHANNDIYDLEIVFAGMTVPQDGSAPYAIDGFEVYAEGQKFAGTSAPRWDVEKKAYVLTLDYGNSFFDPSATGASRKAFVVRAYKGIKDISYSDFSSPPLALFATAPIADLTFDLKDEYVELATVPDITNTNLCGNRVIDTSAGELCDYSVSTTLTCPTGEGIGTCNNACQIEGCTAISITPIITDLNANNGHLISAINLTYYSKGTEITVTPTLQNADVNTVYTWAGCDNSSSNSCTFVPTVAGSHDITLTLSPGGATLTKSFYTPELVSDNYIYSKAGANNVDWNTATNVCTSLTEGGVAAGKWKLPGKDVLAPPIAGATANPFTYDTERQVWCNYNGTSCANMPNNAGGTPKVHWAFEEDPGNSANALIVTFASGNQYSSTSKIPTTGLTNYGYRCVIAK